MVKRTIRIGRKYSEWRISAYECEVDSSGVPIRKRKSRGEGSGYVRGWYGMFDTYRLQNEIMPKLDEYVAQGWSYPFLITQHRLENKATLDIIPPTDLKYYPHKRQSEQPWLAVVLSHKKFKLLSPI